MDIDNIKRGLRAEIKKRENEQYSTFQTNVREMCKDVLAKLEEQEALIKEMEELEYVKTDSSETMDTYRKDGEMSLFNLIHYTVPGTNITGYTLLFNPFF